MTEDSLPHHATLLIAPLGMSVEASTSVDPLRPKLK